MNNLYIAYGYAIEKNAGFMGVLSGVNARKARTFANNVAKGGDSLIKRQRNAYAVKMTKKDMRSQMRFMDRINPFKKTPLNKQKMVGYGNEYYLTPQYADLRKRVDNAASIADHEAFKRDALRVGVAGGVGYGGYKGYQMLGAQTPYTTSPAQEYGYYPGQ